MVQLELKKFFHKKRVLITGHTGFKGSWLARILLGWGSDVSGLSLPPHTEPNLFGALSLEKDMPSHLCDIRDPEKVRAVFYKEQPEIVFHLAAQALVRKSYVEPVYTFSVNTLGTLHVLDAIKTAESVKGAVMVTTDKVYENKGDGRPYAEEDGLGGHDPYSASKAAAEIVSMSYLRSFFHKEVFGSAHNTLIASARAGNVVGGGDWADDRLIPDVIRSFYEKRGKLILRNPNQIRPWQHVLEPLYGYLLLAKALGSGDIAKAGFWNFGPDYKEAFSVAELVRMTEKIIGKIDYEVRPDTAKPEAAVLKLDSSKAARELGWTPCLSAEDSVALTLRWYRDYYENSKGISKITDEQIKSYFG